MSRKWLMSVLVAVLLFMTVAVLPVVVAQVLPLTDVTFTGRLTGIQYLTGGNSGTVQVDKVMAGPALDPEVRIYSYVIPECAGMEWDPNLQVGDQVEVHGIYESPDSVKICGPGYYVRRIQVIGGVIVPVNKLELLAPWLGLAALASLATLTVAMVRRRRSA